MLQHHVREFSQVYFAIAILVNFAYQLIPDALVIIPALSQHLFQFIRTDAS
jgi:hypothetical protein